MTALDKYLIKLANLGLISSRDYTLSYFEISSEGIKSMGSLDSTLAELKGEKTRTNI